MQINTISHTKNQISFKGTPTISKIAQNVADIVLSYRRPFKGETFTPQDYDYLRTRIASQFTPFIQKGEQIPIVLIGFSMKSPSPLKTISKDADRAEFEALKHLKEIMDKISNVYPEGSNLKIYADGRVFVNTIVGSSDNAVTRYLTGVRRFLQKLNAPNIEIISPEDFYHTTPEKARTALFSDFPIDREEMLKNIETDPFLKPYKTFMRDFYAKDIRAQDPSMSIRQSRKEGEKVAFGVICVAEALDRYIKSVFKDAMLRISVHAKPINDLYNKIGIYLNPLKSNCPMPWHGAAVKIPQQDGSEKFIYEKKALLEQVGCKLIPDIDGKGAYYELPSEFRINPDLSFKENILINNSNKIPPEA